MPGPLPVTMVQCLIYNVFQPFFQWEDAVETMQLGIHDIHSILMNIRYY